jgi:hypothetical protein
VITTVVGAVTLPALIVKDGEVVAPAATTTADGTTAAFGLELVSVTSTPPIPAGPFRATRFRKPFVPETSGLGETVKDDTATGFNVTVAVFELPAYRAVIETDVVVVTFAVVMLNAGEIFAPAATAIVAGTAAIDELDDVRLTSAPPAGARPSRVAVLFPSVAPPIAVVAGTDSADSAGGLSVRTAVFDDPAYVAVIATVVVNETPAVVMLKVGEMAAPAGIVTVAGTVARAGLTLVRLMTAPCGPAGPASVTVLLPIVLPPRAGLGASDRAEIAAGTTVSLPVTLDPAYLAVIATTVLALTLVVVIVKVAEVDPAAIVT